MRIYTCFDQLHGFTSPDSSPTGAYAGVAKTSGVGACHQLPDLLLQGALRRLSTQDD